MSETTSRANFIACTGVALTGAVAFATGVRAPAIARNAKITYWSPLDPKASDARARGEAAMIDIFHKRHPDITVEVQPVPWQTMGQQLLLAVNAGEGPDVAQLSSTNLPDQIAAGTVAPLDDMVGKTWKKKDRDDFILPWDNTVYNGRKMAYYWNTLLNNELWYLKDIGGTPPDNWTKFALWLQSHSKSGMSGFLTGLSENGNAIELTDWLIPAFWASGAEYVTASGDIGFDNDNGAKPFEWLLSLVNKYKVTPSSITSLTRDNVLDAVKQRKTMTTLLTSNILGSVQTALHGELALAMQPGPNGPAPAFATGKYLVMTKTSKEREAAGLFIESLISHDAQLANAKIAKELPCLKSVGRDPYFDTPEGSNQRFALEYIQKHPHPYKYSMHTDYLQTQLALAAQQMMSGTPVRKALHDVAEKWEAQRGKQ